MRRRIVWTIEARRDLVAIRDYIRPFAPRAATGYVRRIRKKVEEVASVPEAGFVVRERGLDNLREVYLGEYRIMNRFDDQVIEVMTVWHGARRFGADD